MPRIFIPQEWADSAVMEDRVQIQGDIMSVRVDGKSYKMREAVRFLNVEGGDPDASGLVGKVKTLEDLASQGAEHMGDSVISGDTAYKVQQGFIVEFQGSGDPVSVVFRT